jgi:phosphoesterase RecJ-like protein
MRTEEMIASAIKHGEKFLVVSHMNPDGDAIGSSIGLSLVLESMGKRVFTYNESAVPALYRFIPHSHRITQELPREEVDVTFVLDCSTEERVGEKFKEFAGKGLVVVADHHPPSAPMEGLHLIRTDASATAELIYDILEELDVPLSPESATALYVAIMTDTGSFKFSNTTSRALEVAAQLLSFGANHRLIVEHIYESFPPERFRLMAMALGTLHFLKEGKVASVWVTRSMFQEARANDEMTEGFVDIPRSIRGVEVAMLLREKDGCDIRVNLRSRGKVDVADIASRFGGGGHPNAAGCTLKGSLIEAEECLLKALEEAMG